MRGCACRNEANHEGHCGRGVAEYPTDDGSTIGLCSFCRTDCWVPYFATFFPPSRKAEHQMMPDDEPPARIGGTPIDESPSYRASMRQAGRGHLLRW